MWESVTFVFEPIHVKDFALGAATTLALRRGRIQFILDKILPGENTANE